MCACGVTSIARLGQAYNEEAFRYLLERERRCAERARESLLIVLVSLKRQPGRGAQRLPADAAAGIFCGLWSSVRDVDPVGWFRDGRVVGAILTQGPDPLASDVPQRVGARTARVLLEHLAPAVAERLQVRVLRLRPPRKRHQL